MRRRIWTAFTLVELLVVIAIIGILVALLLPAIQAAREAARRTQCNNKMKQLGLALHTYHDTHRVFPPAQVANRDCLSGIPYPGYTAMNLNGLVLLLPYLEQQALFDEFDFNYAFGTNVHGTVSPPPPLAGGGTGPNAAIVARDPPDAFACPSDEVHASYRRRTNYDFLTVRTWSQCSHWQARSLTTRTMFEDGSTCNARDILDGLSNTAAMAETWRQCCCNGSNAEWAQRTYTQVGLSLEHRPPNYTWYNVSWANPPHLCNDLYNGRRLGDWMHTGSKHPGGLNILMADAAVRFMSETADATLRQRLQRIADGNPVEQF